jgi:hypothetical protein
MTTIKSYCRHSFIVFTFILPVIAIAATTKTITQAFDAAELERLELEISVAELDIEIVDGDVIELEVQLEAERRFFGLRSGSVDDVELVTHRSNSTLFLGIEDKNAEQHWVMHIPRNLALAISVGVGEVDIDKLENDLTLEVGVGAVRVDVIESAFADIQLQTGIGDAVIRGLKYRADNERSFISADAYYEGQGEHHISIDLGVGDALVRDQR